jgi:hypothetical protein
MNSSTIHNFFKGENVVVPIISIFPGSVRQYFVQQIHGLLRKWSRAWIKGMARKQLLRVFFVLW